MVRKLHKKKLHHLGGGIPLLYEADLLSLQKLRLRDILVEVALMRSPLLDQGKLPEEGRSSIGCPF